MSWLLWLLLTTPPQPAGVVIDVHRPVELSGRKVSSPRQIHIRPSGSKAAVGARMSIERHDGSAVLAVGEVEVVEVRGDVWVAKVVEDGLVADDDAGAPVIMVGDAVRVLAVAGQTDDAELKRLRAERDALERAARSRRTPPAKVTPPAAPERKLPRYEREVMKWRL